VDEANTSGGFMLWRASCEGHGTAVEDDLNSHLTEIMAEKV